MNNINLISNDKSSDYQAKVQAALVEKLSTVKGNDDSEAKSIGNGSVVKVEISALGAEELDKVRKSWENQPVSALYRTDIPVSKNAEGIYRIGKVDFSEEEYEAARNLVTGLSSQLKQGTLSYNDHTKMAIAESLVERCSSSAFSKEQSEVIVKAMKDYNERLVGRNKELLSKSSYVENENDSEKQYWGLRGVIPEEVKERMQSLFGRKPIGTASLTSIATNRELIDNLQKKAKELDLTDKNGMDQFMAFYQSAMKPAYDAQYPDEIRTDSYAAIELDLNGPEGIAKLVDFAKQWMNSLQ